MHCHPNLTLILNLSFLQMFVEKTHHWQETPLTEIDPEDAQRTSEDIHR